MGRVWGNASGHPLCVEGEMVEGKIDMDTWAVVNGLTGGSGVAKE